MLGIKECLVECVTLCVKSEVILECMYICYCCIVWQNGNLFTFLGIDIGQSEPVEGQKIWRGSVVYFNHVAAGESK